MFDPSLFVIIRKHKQLQVKDLSAFIDSLLTLKDSDQQEDDFSTVKVVFIRRYED